VCTVAVIVITSSAQGEGKSGVAAAIARHYAYLGQPVRLARLTADGDTESAEVDAAYFGSLDFVPGSASEPATSVTDPGDALLVVEAPLAQAAISGAKVVLVARNAVPAKLPDGLEVSAVVVTAAAGETPHEVAGKPVITLVEDRVLNGFSVAEARKLLNAEVLVEGEPRDGSCDHLVIAPIASDAGQPYFRRFGSKAIVARYDRTDMHLAAMQAEPEVLILTGGRRPSDYLFDAANARGVTVLLSRTDTENTVIALESVFDRTRFQGERKLDRMAELLEASALFGAL
jgi:hypothetical protein